MFSQNCMKLLCIDQISSYPMHETLFGTFYEYFGSIARRPYTNCLGSTYRMELVSWNWIQLEHTHNNFVIGLMLDQVFL